MDGGSWQSHFTLTGQNATANSTVSYSIAPHANFQVLPEEEDPEFSNNSEHYGEGLAEFSHEPGHNDQEVSIRYLKTVILINAPVTILGKIRWVLLYR